MTTVATDAVHAAAREAIDVGRIPAEIRDLPRWVIWRYEQRPGDPKPTKVPYQAQAPNRKAASTRSTTWSTFDIAIRGVHEGRADGIGFCLGDDWSGADFDDCVDPVTGAIEENELDPDTGELAPGALAFVRELDSYTEVSPSGQGLKVLIRGVKPAGRCKRGCTWGSERKGKIEMYGSARFFTITGRHLKGTPTVVENRTDALARVHASVFPPPSANGSEPPLPPEPLDIDDHELIERALAASNGAKFRALWNGQWNQFYSSQSEADQALCNLLAFWTGREAGHMDRLFRSSGLMRKKWEREDYRQRTIDKAVADCTETYAPGRGRYQTSTAPEHDEYDRIEREAIQADSEDPSGAESAVDHEPAPAPPPGAGPLAPPTWRTLADIDDSPPGELICGMLEPDGPTLIYAAGGTGKGMTGAWLIAECLKLGIRPFIYDAEGHPREWRRRTSGLAVDPADVVYVEPRDLPRELLGQPLHKVVPYLAKIATAAGCGLVIVDSILAAANLSEEGLKSDAAAPYLYASALGEIGIPSVSFGHTPKNNAQGECYGSVSWTNAMRLTWHGVQAEGDGHRVRWTPRKRNERGDIRALVLTFGYDAAGRLSSVEVSDAERVSRELVTTLLMQEPMTVEQLAEEIIDSGSDHGGSYTDQVTRTKETVRKTLGRMRKSKLAHKQGGRNGLWMLGWPEKTSRKDQEG